MIRDVGGPAIDLPPHEFECRVKRLRTWQAREALDAVVIASDINRYYFTGVETSNGWVVSERKGPTAFYTDFRYLTMARNRLKFMPTRAIWRMSEASDAWHRIGQTWRRVGYEGRLSAATFNRLQAALPGVEWVDIESDLETFRAVKSKAEQRLIRQAVTANDHLFSELCKAVAVGVSEWDLRAVVRREADRLGEGEAFDTIACVGRNSAECHHHPDQTKLRTGQPLLVDLGVKVNRYCSDMTRSLFFGSPTPLYREIHALVLAANRRAIRAIRPGRRCDDIDAVARDFLEKAGYGKYFGHSLGHSLGLEIHEAPSFSPSCETVLQPGMVLTVEPGVYLPGRFGVRIEDVVLITDDGCEVLSQTPRDLALSI